MNKEELYSYVDHTLLKPTCNWEEIEALCEEAVTHHTASVCIPPGFVANVKKAFPDLNICTVIGFPNGYNTPEVKAFEAKQAILEGAHEIDMVINQTYVKSGRFDEVEAEIRLVREACKDHVLKVIIETCNLTEGEKIAMCCVVRDAGADYIKTSTGFGEGGATVEDIRLFKDVLGNDLKIKAAGGIRTKEDMETFIQLGCSRIGTSSAVSILEQS